MSANRCRLLASPIGPLCLVGDAAGRLIQIRFPRQGLADRPAGLAESADCLGEAVTQLDEYFNGRRDRFELRLAPRGTPFQLEVWNALQDLAFAETVSYAALARRIGRPAAVRAVGAANGRNPLPIVIPCHRVIGADGSLTGFGGGLAAKAWLLRHEAEIAGLQAPQQAKLFD